MHDRKSLIADAEEAVRQASYAFGPQSLATADAMQALVDLVKQLKEPYNDLDSIEKQIADIRAMATTKVGGEKPAETPTRKSAKQRLSSAACPSDASRGSGCLSAVVC